MIWFPPATNLLQGYVFTGVCDSVHRGREWQGACVAEVCVELSGTCVGVCGACMAGGMHDKGRAWQGVCIAGGMHGRGCAWRGRGHVWQGAYVGGSGACMGDVWERGMRRGGGRGMYVGCVGGMCGRGVCVGGGHL